MSYRNGSQLYFAPNGVLLQSSSCRDVEVTAAEMHIISCYVHSLKATAIVTEEDTGVEIKAEKHVSIFRTGITFKTVYADNYLYPNLPSTLKVRNTCEILQFYIKSRERYFKKKRLETVSNVLNVFRK